MYQDQENQREEPIDLTQIDLKITTNEYGVRMPDRRNLSGELDTVLRENGFYPPHPEEETSE